MFTDWSEGQQPATGVKAHWFNPLLVNTVDGTLIIDPYTNNYDNGNAPWNVTLTTTLISNSGASVSVPIAIASYETGFNFHTEDTSLSDGDTALFYDTADSNDPSTGVDIDVQDIDAEGNPIAGTAKTLVSDVADVQQFRVGSAASGGATYDLTYATVNTSTGIETVHYQVYNADGTAVSGESGTIDSFGSTNGEGYGFGTLIPSSQADPTYIYIRASGLGLGGNNLGLKYELVGVNGAATTSTRVIEPSYPTGSTSEDLIGFSYTRLNQTTTSAANLVTVSRYSYIDGSGTENEALDVRTMNAVTQTVFSDVVIPVLIVSSGETITRLADGGFVVGYGNGGNSLLQEFDANGAKVGSVFALPSNETNFNLSQLPDGRLLVEYPQAETGGNQLDYDIYSISPPCYCTGARIQTDHGPVAVEDLATGDLVVTASGAHRPIKWIGHRRLDLTRHSNPHAVWPVCVSAGAFGKNLPVRDLWMSPGHNVFTEGVLMPIRALVNGATVAQVPVDAVTYWHVELDSHDIILAEGLSAESYLDTGNRTAFVNGGAFIEAHPDFEPKHWAETCLPLVKTGPEVVAAKAALLARARGVGHDTTTAHDLHIVADRERIEPITLGDRRFAFAVPRGGQHIALVSRSFVPSQMTAGSTDERRLGVCVKRLHLDGEDVDLRETLADDWHGPEQQPAHVRRWTTGRTALPPATRIVVVDLAEDGIYRVERRDNVVALFA